MPTQNIQPRIEERRGRLMVQPRTTISRLTTKRALLATVRIADGPGTRHVLIERFGESHPVASYDTADGRAQNRRVGLRVE
jgi:hypothetical protein